MTSRTQYLRPRAALVAAVAAAACLIGACSSSGSGDGSPSSGGGTAPRAASSVATSGSVGASSGASSVASSEGAAQDLQGELRKFAQSVTSYPAVTPLSGVTASKGKTVWYVPIGSAVPILAAYGDSIKQAMSTVGITVKTCDGKFLPTSISSCLDQAATQGADGVITGYIDYQLVRTAFDALVAKHIPVLVAGTQNDLGKPDSSMLSVYDTTEGFNLAQKLNIESVITDSGGKAKILYVGNVDSPQTRQGNAYVKSFVGAHCSGCTFAEVDFNTAAIGKVSSQVSAALISHPDTTYVVDEFDSSSALTLQGIQSAGFTSKVKLAAVDGSLDALQRIKAGGPQYVDVGVSPSYSGWSFADGMLRMLTGSTPITQVGVLRVFTKADVGGLALTPSAYATNAWYGSDDYTKTFTTAWGVAG